MNFTEWFLFFLLIQVLHFLGTWKLYVKAGRKAWEAAIPIYNYYILKSCITRIIFSLNKAQNKEKVTVFNGYLTHLSC